MNTLLITGAGGMLGHTLCRIADSDWGTVAVVNLHADIGRAAKTVVQCDITDRQSLTGLFADVNPDAVIHLAAASQPDFCQEHPEESRKVNVEATADIATLCASRDIPSVFTSTDLVFDGEHAPYTEQSPAGPIMAYGRQKLEAEVAWRSAYAGATICRMPLMFGEASPHGGGNFMTIIADKLKNGESVTLFTDEYRTPVGTVSASRGLLWALDHPGQTFHLGGSERISRFDFGLRVARVIGCDEKLVQGNLQSDVKLSAPRPRDVSLDSNKAFAFGYAPLGVDEELSETL